jgi:hypothetical protein
LEDFAACGADGGATRAKKLASVARAVARRVREVPEGAPGTSSVGRRTTADTVAMIRRSLVRSIPVLVFAAIASGCSVGVDPGTGGSPWGSAGAPGGKEDEVEGGASSSGDEADDGSGDASSGVEPQGMPNDSAGESTGGVDDGGKEVGGEVGGDPGGGSEGGAPGGGDCCLPAMQPGCADGAVADCVCAQDPFCCEMQWDEQCVANVDAFGCGACGGADPGGGSEGGEESGGGGGACCAPTGQPGCGDPAIEQCVCGDGGDIFCCVAEWDDVCAQEVVELGCGAC